MSNHLTKLQRVTILALRTDRLHRYDFESPLGAWRYIMRNGKVSGRTVMALVDKGLVAIIATTGGYTASLTDTGIIEGEK